MQARSRQPRAPSTATKERAPFFLTKISNNPTPVNCCYCQRDMANAAEQQTEFTLPFTHMHAHLKQLQPLGLCRRLASAAAGPSPRKAFWGAEPRARQPHTAARAQSAVLYFDDLLWDELRERRVITRNVKIRETDRRLKDIDI